MGFAQVCFALQQAPDPNYKAQRHSTATYGCMHTWIDLYVSYAWHALYSYCKDPSVRELKRIFLEAYFPDRVGELDDPANDEEVCLAYISRACSTCAHAVG